MLSPLLLNIGPVQANSSDRSISAKMAAKRLHDQSDSDLELATDKRTKTAASALTVRDAMMIKLHEHDLGSVLEPQLRRMVREEAEGVVARYANLSRSPSLRIQSLEASSLRLIFAENLFLPIFTNCKIVDLEKNPLQVRLINTNSEGQVPASPIKLDIVVLDGDFPGVDENVDWTSEKFNDSILKPRESKRPLLTGDVQVILRNGVASIGDLEITDNSSWVRSGRFRLGVKVSSAGSYPGRIKEGITVRFQVKDRRGESYQKHSLPALLDKVWRLKKISKEGVLHKKLAAKGVDTVQDFLKMFILDAGNLSKIMGLEMWEKKWKAIVEHALTCEKGDKLYLYRAPNSAILLNPICEVVEVSLNGQAYTPNAITGQIKAYVQGITMEAYNQWDKLEVVDGPVDLNLLSQSDVKAHGKSNPGVVDIGQTSEQQYFGPMEAELSLPINIPRWEQNDGNLQPTNPMHVSVDDDSFQFITPFYDPSMEA